MGVVKRSVSFDADVWDGLVAEAGSGPVSPLVNDALVHYLRRQQGLAVVAAYEAEHGAFTEEELAAADRVLDEAGVVDLTAPTATTEAEAHHAKSASRSEPARERTDLRHRRAAGSRGQRSADVGAAPASS